MSESNAISPLIKSKLSDIKLTEIELCEARISLPHHSCNVVPIYLVDFACYKPKGVCKCTRQRFMEFSSFIGTFTEQSLEFQRKIMERSGIGESTYVPEALMRVPPNPSLAEARKEAEALPKNVLSFNLIGMGCSADVISIDLAKDLLRVHPSSYALVISLENITLNWYFGNDKSMLLSNCLFRMGGAAIFLSSRRWDRRRSKYQLLHIVSTNKATDDKCFSCVTQKADSTGMIGVSLSKDLMAVAGDALRTNIRTLGPLELPMSDKLLFFGTLVGKKLFKMKVWKHFKQFTLVRISLHRSRGRIKKGHRVWQMAFGSGFKCNSAVWKALRKVNPEKEKNPWIDEIDQFPVDVPEFSAI
ncbi:hypothetical protein RIF29_34256 [Crotalaria pallida]|uniref:FAE domain-containing protein n=1 Tax=Crotalaria pallida TaxID=3830 RepID=A0AAN9EBH0_CROPI